MRNILTSSCQVLKYFDLLFFTTAGHLTFQCFNTEGTSTIVDDVESTTSDSEDEMQQLEAQLKEKRKQEECKII